ncbi:oligopeptide ABC transporter ATP-binding protein [Actinorhabdospora filicis]|uniref:Oligopeptide ABC transporter ATP-binding protein n=1 Tax=Actinorhabdospora filicis TaxID=1785913 RepID=A0A9W6SJ05_9ACTN|nr:ABC transporter ATP-binding protein [Actinorhabdospora filicis]GLZ76697.1 oligopeptide ABC transporter ATP-binding protein [Actinorhabdospora filicis]
MSEPLITLRNVSQTFGSKKGDLKAVDDVSLSVGPGEVLCLVGESGCGKTTTARMAAGLAKPTAGTVEFQGRDIWSMSKSEFAEYRTAVQYVHQDPYASLNPIRDIHKTLASPLRKHGVARNRKEGWDKAAALLEQVDLTPAEAYLPKFPHQLSGGQRQRVSVARALTLDPKLIIADESTSMLDVSIRIGMLNMLGRLRDELNVGFLFITHDLAIAKYFGWQGRIAVMYLGRVVEFGPTPQVINNPQHPYTKALLDAVPEPDPDLTRTKKAGGGLRSSEIPSLAMLPTGCSFHPRCPLFEADTCDAHRPELQGLDAGREVSCHVVGRAATTPEPTAEAGTVPEPTAQAGSVPEPTAQAGSVPGPAVQAGSTPVIPQPRDGEETE